MSAKKFVKSNSKYISKTKNWLKYVRGKTQAVTVFPGRIIDKNHPAF